MSGSESRIGGQVVKEYLDKFPKASTHTLASIIHKENPELFKDKEAARYRVRYYRGAAGSDNKRKLSTKKYLKKHGQGADTFSMLPKGLTTIDDWRTIKIVGDHRILVLSDVHIPYHHKPSLQLAIEHAKKTDIDIIMLNGDWLDHFSISRWEKDPRQRDFSWEVEVAKISFELLRKVFPKARIIFKEGNHEERYTNYMEVRAPEMLGVPEFAFKQVFHLDDFDIEYIDSRKPVKFNELFVIHGHEYKFAMTSPVNPARGLYLRSKVNALCGHFHQPSSHSESDLDEKHTGCWSTGHLSDPHPRYMPLNKWSHGFATIDTQGKKNFQVQNYKIIDSEIFRA